VRVARLPAAAWVCLFWVCSGCAAASPTASKPEHPLTAAFTPETIAAQPGESVTVILTVSTTRAFARAGLTLKVPEGMALIAGQAEKPLVNLRPGEAMTFIYVLRVEKPGELRLLAAIAVDTGDPNFVLNQSAVAIVNPAPEANPPEVRTDAEGQPLRIQSVKTKKAP